MALGGMAYLTFITVPMLTVIVVFDCKLFARA